MDLDTEASQRKQPRLNHSRIVVKDWLLEALTTLRLDYAKRLKQLRGEFPECHLPCETCAFRSSTDNDDGFDTTAMNVLSAMANGKPFYCHQPELVNGDYLPRLLLDEEGRWTGSYQFCAAYAVLVSTDPPFDVRQLLDRHT